METPYTVIGYYQFTECVSCETVKARDAGEAAYLCIRPKEETDYIFLGVIAGSHKLLGGYEKLDPDRLQDIAKLIDRHDDHVMTSIGFDMFDKADVKAEVCQATFWELAMMHTMTVRGRHFQPVCVLEGALAFTLTAQDIEGQLEYV